MTFFSRHDKKNKNFIQISPIHAVLVVVIVVVVVAAI